MKKRIFVALTGLMLSVVLAACGSSSSADYAVMEEAAAEAVEMNSFGSDSYMADEMTGETLKTTAQNNSDLSNRKLIKTVNLDVETKNYDEMLANLEMRIAELGGYIESLESYGSESRYASITARIPADKLDGFVKHIGETANVIGRSESVEDVTLQYVDLDSHARMLEEEQERLLALLEGASTIEEMITIEERLGEIKYQLESMRSQLRTFDNLVAYSTVHISLDEVIELTPVVELSDGERIAQGFAKSVADVTNGIKEFFIDLIIHIPYIIVWGVVIGIIILIVRMIMKISDKRSEKLHQERIASGNYQSPYVNRPNATLGKGEHEQTTDNKNTK